MENITNHSIDRAADEAVKIWALSSAQYPLQNRLIQEYANATFLEVVSSFALNARRAMEVLPANVKYPLAAARWIWKPTAKGELVKDLKHALDRVMHAQILIVGFERAPKKLSVIDGGAIIIPYIQAQTDRRELAFIDPFSMSHAFLYNVLPSLLELQHKNAQEKQIDA